MTDLSALVPELQPFAQGLIDLAGRAGVQPRVTSTLRTYSEQERLYRAFLRGERHYPVAPPGRSAHEFGMAFDMVASTQSDLHDLGQVWRQWGGVWSPNDEVHFELPGFAALLRQGSLPAEGTQTVQCGPAKRTLLKAADLIAGFLPGVGEVELGAALLQLGFPDSEVLAFLSDPLYTLGC